MANPSKLSGSAYEGSGGEGEEGREGRVCLVLKSPLATPLLNIIIVITIITSSVAAVFGRYSMPPPISNPDL